MCEPPGMIRRFLLLALLLVLPLGAAEAGDASRDYMVTSFTRVSIDGPLTVVITASANPAVVARGDHDMIERLIVRKTGDRLRLSLSRTATEIDPARRRAGNLRIEVASWAIEQLDVNGPADITLDKLTGQTATVNMAGAARLTVGSASIDVFDIAMTGSGSLAITKGDANRTRISLNGAPKLLATGFQSDELTLSLVGPASVEIGARDTARISASGAGDIRIVGRAACDIQSAGMAQIACGGL